MLRFCEGMQLPVERRPRIANQRATHHITGADQIFRQACGDEIGVRPQIHIERRRHHVIRHQRYAVFVQQRCDATEIRRA